MRPVAPLLVLALLLVPTVGAAPVAYTGLGVAWEGSRDTWRDHEPLPGAVCWHGLATYRLTVTLEAATRADVLRVTAPGPDGSTVEALARRDAPAVLETSLDPCTKDDGFVVEGLDVTAAVGYSYVLERIY